MKDYITDVEPIHSKNTIISPSKGKQGNVKKVKSETKIDNFLPLKISKDTVLRCGLSRKTKRKFMAGKTIDLHGLTKAQAFEAIIKFFANCRSKNIRNVLVITGGSIQRNPVIRSSFIKWISEYFSEYVSSYDTARPLDGGEGAFYVTLKSGIKDNLTI